MPHRVGGRASTTSPASSLSSRRWIATTPSHLASKWHPARAAKAAAAARAAAAEEDGGVASATAEQRAAVLAKLPSVCPGCGVGLQCDDHNLPGYFVIPQRLLDAEEEGEADGAADADDGGLDGVDAAADDVDPATAAFNARLAEAREMEALAADDDDDDDDDDDAMEDAMEDALDGISYDDDETFELPADFDDGLGEDAIEVDEDAALGALNAMFDDDDDRRDRDDDDEEEEDRRREERKAARKKNPNLVTCARCYSLRHHGVVKNQAAEILMPSFDFGRVVGNKLKRTGPGGAVILLLVDIVDFDASFPIDAVDFLDPYVKDETVDVLLVANKVDLLPTQCTRARVSTFARRRAKSHGLRKAAGVHLVSAHTGMGINTLSEQLMQLLEDGREVWVVGAQNVGKSSLINRLSRRFDGPGPEDGGPLASHLPGTTLGVVKLPKLLPNGTDVYDTPGLLQPFQVSSRLTGEEARMVLPRRRLSPRTYRVEVGGSIHLGGLARVDYLDGPQRTVYLTVWVSDDVVSHYVVRGENGKADALYEKHAGGKLSPPIGENRVKQLGEWGSRTVTVYGTDWNTSTRDISIGGLGWVGVGVNGEASFRVWTHEGVNVETREALVPDMARALHRPGFSNEQQHSGGKGGSKGRPSKKIMRGGGYNAPTKSKRGGGGGGGGDFNF